MKKLAGVIFLSILISLLFLFKERMVAQGTYPDGTVFYNLGTGVTNMAASSTNTTVGFNYPIQNPYKGVMVTFSAITYTNTGFINIYFQRSPDATVYETPLNSPIRLTMWLTNSASANLPTTNVISDWFNLVGASRIRECRIENNSGTSLSNSQVIVSYPADYSVQDRP